MKYWMVVLGLAACLSGCSPQKSSSIDPAQLNPPAGSGQGKPVPAEEMPDFDWDVLEGITAVYSNAVTVSAGNKQYSDANLLVTLSGQASSANEHPIVQVRWAQFSGPRAVIANPNQLRTQVLLPQVAAPTTAVFRLAAINAIGEVNSAQVSVMIRPLSSPLTVTSSGVGEEDRELTFSVSLAEPAREQIQLSFFTVDDTAIAGEDYVARSGTLTFFEGQTHKSISVRLLQDNIPEPGEVFFLHLEGEVYGEPVVLRRLGLIVDRLEERNLLSSIPVAQPIQSPDLENLPGEHGIPRLLLRWEDEGRVRLVVEDPCGNLIAGSEPPPPCQGMAPLVQTGTLSGERFSYFENMAWVAGAAGGTHKIYLEHVAGQAVDYSLEVYGDFAIRYSGVMANGERLEITSLLQEGGEGGGNRVTGTIVNATNTAPISGARVRFYQDETLVEDLTASSSFGIPLASGVYLMVVTAEGYLDWSREVTITAEEALAVQVSLSRKLNIETEVARVVLSWGASPSDLDSHLMGPGFHLYYMSPDVGSAVLDVDDTSGFGPETITIRNWENGPYRYYVYNFSGGASGLASSGAVVQLYLGDMGVQVFQVPQGEGLVWHVFDLDPATGLVTTVNAIVDGVYAPDDPAALSGD